MDEAANNSADSQLEAEADLERAAHAYRTASEIWRLKHELIVGIMNLSSRFLVMRRRECSHSPGIERRAVAMMRKCPARRRRRSP
uniref:Uncharacterized protein n=1 Tax=Hyaloperonospora arabidopsidis (strain Emoy2) TaxID=559515 RepID=M4BWH2_HYAAE